MGDACDSCPEISNPTQVHRKGWGELVDEAPGLWMGSGWATLFSYQAALVRAGPSQTDADSDLVGDVCDTNEDR